MAESQVDIWQLATRVLRYWWVVAMVTLLVGSGFVYYALNAPKIYRVSAKMLPASSMGVSPAGSGVMGQLGGLASLAGINVSRESPTEEALTVLRSRDFVLRFVDDLVLRPRLFEKMWDAGRGDWKAGFAAPGDGRTFRAFSAIRSVSQDRRTGMIVLSIDWGDRDEAVHWVEETIRRINEEMRQRASKAAEANIGFLEAALKDNPTVAVQSAINRLIEFQVNERMLATVNQDYVFRVVEAAVKPDADEQIAPRKRLIAMIGIAVGGGLGVLLALLVDVLRVRAGRR